MDAHRQQKLPAASADPAPPETEAADDHSAVVRDAATAVGVALAPAWAALLAELLKRIERRHRERRDKD